jgi:hypothetical protein
LWNKIRRGSAPTVFGQNGSILEEAQNRGQAGANLSCWLLGERGERVVHRVRRGIEKQRRAHAGLPEQQQCVSVRPGPIEKGSDPHLTPRRIRPGLRPQQRHFAESQGSSTGGSGH